MIGALLEIFSLALTTSEESRDLLEIPDDRYPVRATMIASQVPTDRWHEWFPDPTVADAVLDRVIHHAYQVPIHGESMRKILPTAADSAITESPSTGT